MFVINRMNEHRVNILYLGGVWWAGLGGGVVVG